MKHICLEVCYAVQWLVPLLLQSRVQGKRKCLALFCFALLSSDFSCVALLCLAELRLSVAVAVAAAVAVVLSVAVAVVAGFALLCLGFALLCCALLCFALLCSALLCFASSFL